MRITHHRLVEQVINNVEAQMERLSRSQEQATTGLRVNRTSDDPVAASEILNLQTRLDRLEQYRRNINSGLSSLNLTENTLGQVRDLGVRVRSLTVQGANDVTTAEGREALAEEIDQEIRQLLSLANTKHNGRYLFGGNEIRQSPYESTEGENGWLETVTPTFRQGQDRLELIIDEGERMEMTVTAEDTFALGDADDLFDILFDLRQALADNDGEAIGDMLPRLDEALEKLNGVTSMVGSRIQSAQEILNRFDEKEITLTSRISDIGDVDIADALTRLNEDMTSYELALRTSAKSIQPSLVNFVYL